MCSVDSLCIAARVVVVYDTLGSITGLIRLVQAEPCSDDSAAGLLLSRQILQKSRSNQNNPYTIKNSSNLVEYMRASCQPSARVIS